MILVESNGNPDAKSASNAIGLTQVIARWHLDLINRIARDFGKNARGEQALYDPEVNVRVGASHLRWCYTSDGRGSWERAVRKYFTGTADPPPGFENGQGTTPDQHIAKFRAALLQVAADTQEIPMVKPYILIVAGHRSTQDPGNPVERELTDDLAIAYTDAFRDAGYEADWFQRDLDRDSHGTMTIGSLTTVAVGCRNVLAARPEPMSIMLDLHFNGSESGVHAIPPSWSPGLGAAFSGDHQSDTEANNTLDFRLARTIVRNICNATGMRLLGADGIMRERNTGVGLEKKSRLGMLSATVTVRNKAVRMVIEHGGTNDPKRIPDFAGKCARAALLAVNTEFVGTGTPDPETPVDPIVYPFGMNRQTIDKLFGTVAAFDPTGPVSKLWLENGSQTGRFPELTDLIQEADGSKFYVFSSGEVIVAEPGKPVAYVAAIAA
jgi:hypothetical protein